MSELEIPKTLNNPLSHLISDEIFELLESRGLIHERAISINTTSGFIFSSSTRKVSQS